MENLETTDLSEVSASESNLDNQPDPEAVEQDNAELPPIDGEARDVDGDEVVAVLKL